EIPTLPAPKPSETEEQSTEVAFARGWKKGYQSLRIRADFIAIDLGTNIMDVILGMQEDQCVLIQFQNLETEERDRFGE
ncbi:hypothetical protein Csa_019587, partial [Cucumis sativus]